MEAKVIWSITGPYVAIHWYCCQCLAHGCCTRVTIMAMWDSQLYCHPRKESRLAAAVVVVVVVLKVVRVVVRMVVVVVERNGGT